MLCFRCGSPVDSNATSCPNCGQDLQGSFEPDTDSLVDLQRQLRKGERERTQPNTYRVGEVVLERYEITDLLGRGPLGVVYKALDQEVEVDVALKVIDAEVVSGEEERDAFLEAAGAMRQVVHNNIVRYFDVDCDGDRCFYVTQFLEGLTLRKIIDLRKEKGQRFSLPEVEPICAQLCDALSTEGVVHGGMKPNNVIILPDLLKVTDFGLADALPRDVYLAAQREAGSAYAYLAPEVRDGGRYDERADVFSVAVIVTELLSGQVYQGGPHLNLHELDPAIPEAVDELLAHALTESPDARLATARSLADALTAIVSGGDSTGVDGGNRTTASYGGSATSKRDGDASASDELASSASLRETIRIGSPDGDRGILDARGRPRTLGYGAKVDRAAVEARVAGASKGKKSEKEVTQQLSIDDVEDLDGEEAEAALAAAAEASQSAVAAAREGSSSAVSLGAPPSSSKKTSSSKKASPPEKTQALSVDDLEIVDGDVRGGSGQTAYPDDNYPEDNDVTVPRMSLEEAMGPQPTPEAEDSLFPFSREGGPGSDKTQQIDPAMIVDTEDDEADQEQLVLAPSEDLRDSAAVSGETESSVKPLAELRSEAERMLPHQRPGRSRSEARARDVLSAFDAAEESGAQPLPEPPLGIDSDPDAFIEPAEAPSPGAPLPEVAPEVLHEDAVPAPLDQTMAIDKPLPPPPQRHRQRQRSQIFMAILIGFGVGGVTAVAYSLM
ncbi:MAG: protein kinase, partial [Deltaproteobacteria bacterium]|nr:protein kinase [Deltaproteobacteria bacterium]